MVNSLFGKFPNLTFCDIFGTLEDFTAFIDGECKIPFHNQTATKSSEITYLYYALYAKFGNSSITSFDTMQWKYRLALIISEYAPAWYKRLKLQEELRNLTPTELQEYARQFSNTGVNPSNTPLTTDTTGIKSDTRAVSIQQRGKAEQYSILMQLISTDVTAEFLALFRQLFCPIVAKLCPIFYETEDD